MSYIGKEPQFTQYPSKFFNGDGTAMTVSLDYAPPNAAALLVFIDGVRQDTSAYTLSGTSLTFTGTVPSGTNNVQVVHLGLTQDVGVPTDDTISTAKLQDDAVTTAKLDDDSVTSAKLANALNITSGNSLTIDSGATLDINGTADFAGATVSGLSAGKVLQVVETDYTTQVSTTSTSYVTAGLSQSITPSSTSNKILVVASVLAHCVSGGGALYRLYKDNTTGIGNNRYFSSSSGSQTGVMHLMCLHSPSTTSSVTYGAYLSAVPGGGTAYAQYSGYGSRIMLMEIEA